LGIVKLHEYVVKDHLTQGTLKELLPSSRSPLPIYIAYPQRRYLSSKVRCFIDFVVERVKF
jgi:DNA-binding transcriptional LysR family regulator